SAASAGSSSARCAPARTAAPTCTPACNRRCSACVRWWSARPRRPHDRLIRPPQQPAGPDGEETGGSTPYVMEVIAVGGARSTSDDALEQATPRPPSAGPMPRRLEWAFLFFSTWIVLGVFIDGWAHNHHKPESFFTPWHVFLDSGLIATVTFGLLVAR